MAFGDRNPYSLTGAATAMPKYEEARYQLSKASRARLGDPDERENPLLPGWMSFMLWMAGLGTAGTVLYNGVTTTYANFKEPSDSTKVQQLAAESLARGTMKLEVKTPDGKTVLLNDLSPKERALTIENATKKLIDDSSSRHPVETKEVSVAFTDPNLGYICTLNVHPEFFRPALKGEPIPAMNTQQAIKYAQALGNQCGLSADKIEAMKVNPISGLRVAAEKPSPYGIAPDGRAVMQQRVAEPNVVASAPAK